MSDLAINRCNNPHCQIAVTGRCVRAPEFADWHVECPDLYRDPAQHGNNVINSGNATPPPRANGEAINHSQPNQNPPRKDEDTPAYDLRQFWNGNALSWRDAGDLIAQIPSLPIGILGLRDSGKTCYLASLYLQLANGHRRDLKYRLIGSRTLLAFQTLAEHAGRHTRERGGPIVPRTTENIDALRDGLLLHLALRPETLADDRVLPLFMTDFPGEWFKKWIVGAMDDTIPALKIFSYCRAFMLLIEAPRVDGRIDPMAVREYGQLLERLAKLSCSFTAKTQLAVIITKCDQVLGTITGKPQRRLEEWGSMAENLKKVIGALDKVRGHQLEAEIFGTSAFPTPLSEGQPWGVIEPLRWLIEGVDRLKPLARQPHRFFGGHPFWAFGARDEE